MIRSQRFLLQPTNDQLGLICRSAGLARFCWNWAKALSDRHYRMFGNKSGFKRLTHFGLVNRWNKVKNRRSSLFWVKRFSKKIHDNEFRKFDQALSRAFKEVRAGKPPCFPKFHKKGVHESFCVSLAKSDSLKRVGNRFSVPRIGHVKTATLIRWPDAKSVYARAKIVAGRWWLTVAYDLPDPPKLPTDRPSCGIDLGCRILATVVSGGKLVESVSPLKPYAKTKRKLRRLSRIVSRKNKGSKRRKRVVLRLAKYHERAANQRKDYLHKLTARLTRQYGVVVLETLNVSGMMKGTLAGTIADLGFYEFRRQVQYKSEATGSRVVLADRFFPSSKTCSCCGKKNEQLKRSDYVFVCPFCGYTADRDLNAGRNLEQLGHGMPEVTSTPRKTARGSSKKRECSPTKTSSGV